MKLESADFVLAKSNEQRLMDLDWDNRGPGQVVEKFGDDGKVIGGTTLAIELGWLATNFLRVMRKLGDVLAAITSIATKLDALNGKVDALAAKPEAAPAPIDVQALATQLAPLLNANVAEQVMTIIRAQINK